VVWSQLVAIADEAATTLVRTSFSPIVRESNDFACVVFDCAGNAIAENTIGIPSFNVTLAKTLAHFLQQYPIDDWQPGDVGVTNDPWLASGHLPDVSVIAPVYYRGQIIAWTGSIAHMADIGGNLWSVDNQQVYQEGLCLPLLRIVHAGEVDEDIVRIVKANVRLPDQVVGDIMAQVNAGQVAGRRIEELMEEHDLIDLADISAEVCSRAENAMRHAISEIPNGTYGTTVQLDGTEQEDVSITVAINVDEDTITVDYTGTTAEVGASLNVVLNYTDAYTCYPLKCVLDPTTPRNEGSYRPITVIAPEGTILNPRRPAPVNARQLVGHCLSTAIYRALAPAMSDRVIAESGSAPTLRVLVSGMTGQREPFTSILFINGGMGAGSSSDGLSATCFPSNVICGSMETIEATAPLRIWRKELRQDSGGPGRCRGGLGQSVEVELLSKYPATLSLFVEHASRPSRGLLGGWQGAPSVVAKDGKTEGFPLKGRSRLPPGGRVRVEYPGGGGFGPPGERDRELIMADVQGGYVSLETARKVYGMA
jgi:N-methylhydantoinase B